MFSFSAMRMENKSVVVLMLCLFLSVTSSLIYPQMRFGERAAAILMSSSIQNPVQLPADADADKAFRFQRHADAIFTNSYRKVLGQISARKFLQTVMGKRLGAQTQHYVQRQSSL